MLEHIDTSLIDWSRAQFALTAIYHWIFVPLTLGLAVIMGIMETMYYRTGDEFWKRTAKFWMKLFGINFAIGVATGLILEFEFGTNWSNYLADGTWCYDFGLVDTCGKCMDAKSGGDGVQSGYSEK